MKKNKKLISILLATLSGLSSINATEKNKNAKTQHQNNFKNDDNKKITSISKDKNLETQFPKSNKLNKTKLAVYLLSVLFPTTASVFLFKDKIANFLGNQ